MNRRSLLKSLAASSTASTAFLAGCMGSEDPENTTDTTENTTDTTETPTDEPTNNTSPVHTHINLVSVDGLPDDIPVSFDVTIIEDGFVGPGTENDHPARIRITLTNEGKDPYQVMTGHRDVFSTIYSDDGRYALVSEGDDRADTCWKLPDALMTPQVMRSTTVAPDEPSTLELSLLTSHDSPGCLPEGTITFSEDYARPEEDRLMSASFTLQVTKPA